MDSYDKNGKPVKLVRISPNVKAYRPDRTRYDWFDDRDRPEGGAAGVWVDPKSGLATHIFWTSTE